MIESVNNERIKEYAKLSIKKYREETNLFLVEGEHLVEEAIKKNLIKEIFLLKGEENKYNEVTYVTEEILKKLTNLTNPPKIIAVCYKINQDEIKGNTIILDDISDPGNLGTIIRSAVAFNYETIILSPNTVDIYNPKVIRATEGMLFHINYIITDLKPIIDKLTNQNYQIYSTVVTKGKQPQSTKEKHALIVGNEAHGIKEELLVNTIQLNIKMNHLCESLNASIAASIIMYELNK